MSELTRILGVPLQHQSVNLPEIQSLSLQEVVSEKAKAAYAAIGTPVIVEDTALTFHALGKLPGTFIKWFTEELDYQGLCQLLEGRTDRSATVSACIALYDGVTLKLFEGNCKGTIAESPREGEGFGFDCIFIPEGYATAWSEMDTASKDTMSHRGKAAEKFAAYLRSL